MQIVMEKHLTAHSKMGISHSDVVGTDLLQVLCISSYEYKEACLGMERSSGKHS